MPLYADAIIDYYADMLRYMPCYFDAITLFSLRPRHAAAPCILLITPLR